MKTEKTNGIKNFFKKTLAIVKVFGFIAILGVTFYGGMYFMASQYNTENPEKALVSSIENALKSTDGQPVIHIVPAPSLYEKAKNLVGMKEPEREVVTVYTTSDTTLLSVKFQKDEESAISKAYHGTKAAIFNAGTSVADHVSGWYDKAVTWVKE